MAHAVRLRVNSPLAVRCISISLNVARSSTGVDHSRRRVNESTGTRLRKLCAGQEKYWMEVQAAGNQPFSIRACGAGLTLFVSKRIIALAQFETHRNARQIEGLA